MKVMIGVPTGRALLCQETAKTIVSLSLALQSQGHAVVFNTVSHAEVAVSRNVLAALFLDGDCEVFVGIDDDVAVDLSVALGLIRRGANFVGSFIPRRSIDLAAFADAVRAGADTDAARRRATGVIGTVSEGMGEGVHEVAEIGLGFYVLRRTLLQAMADKGIAKAYVTRLPGFTRKTHGFFSNMTLDDGSFISEDYSFCRRVRQAGYRVLAYKGPGLSHIGAMKFDT